MTRDGGSSAEFSRLWQRQQWLWHLVYAVVWLAAVAITFVEPPGPHGRGWALGALVAMALAYVVFGAHALVTNTTWTALSYHVLSWVFLTTILVLDPGSESWILYFILFPHLWAMLSTRLAAGLTVVILVVVTAVRWLASGGTPAVANQLLVTGLIAVVLSLGLGLFITSMVGETERRALIIDELRQTQSTLAAVERDRGVLEERDRISREIHDTLAQGFTSVAALSRAADAALARGDVPTARERLALITGTATDNLNEARAIVAELTPGHLESRSLVEALHRLTQVVTATGELTVGLDVQGAPAGLGGAVDVALLRIAQESLANVRRHSGAACAQVTISYAPDTTTLQVTDTGAGFDTGEQASGFGLDGIHSRAQSVGGRVDVASVPGGGTTVTVEVPR